MSGIMSLPPLFGWARYGFLPLASICFCDWPQSPSYAFFMIACCFCVPCGVMTVCGIRILRAFQRSRKTLQSFAKPPASIPVPSCETSDDVEGGGGRRGSNVAIVSVRGVISDADNGNRQGAKDQYDKVRGSMRLKKVGAFDGSDRENEVLQVEDVEGSYENSKDTNEQGNKRNGKGFSCENEGFTKSQGKQQNSHLHSPNVSDKTGSDKIDMAKTGEEQRSDEYSEHISLDIKSSEDKGRDSSKGNIVDKQLLSVTNVSCTQSTLDLFIVTSSACRSSPQSNQIQETHGNSDSNGSCVNAKDGGEILCITRTTVPESKNTIEYLGEHTESTSRDQDSEALHKANYCHEGDLANNNVFKIKIDSNGVNTESNTETFQDDSNLEDDRFKSSVLQWRDQHTNKDAFKVHLNVPKKRRRSLFVRPFRRSSVRGQFSKPVVPGNLHPIDEDTISDFSSVETVSINSELYTSDLLNNSASSDDAQIPNGFSNSVPSVQVGGIISSSPAYVNSASKFSLPERIQGFMGVLFKTGRLKHCKVKPIGGTRISDIVADPSECASISAVSGSFTVPPSSSFPRDNKQDLASPQRLFVPTNKTTAEFLNHTSKNGEVCSSMNNVHNLSTISSGTTSIADSNNPKNSTFKDSALPEPASVSLTSEHLSETPESTQSLSIPDRMSPSKKFIKNQQHQSSPKRHQSPHSSPHKHRYNKSPQRCLYVNSRKSSPSHSPKSSTSRASGSKKRASVHSQEAISERRRREEIRLTATLLIVVALFILCWFPYCISMFVSIYQPDLSGRGLDMTALLLGYMNSCVNPIVYGLMNRRFKEGYRRLFNKCRFHLRKTHVVN